MGSPMVFHTAPPHPLSKARMICSPQLVGGPEASQKGLGERMPAKLVVRSAIGRSFELARHGQGGALAVGAGRQIYRSHAASAQAAQDAVGAELAAEEGIGGHDRSFVAAAGVGQRVEQRGHFGAQAGIAAAGSFQKLLAVGGLALEHSVKQPFHLLPAFGGHGALPRVNSRWSQALADCHSRFTVGVEICMTSATSCTLRPPKKRSSTMWPCRGSRASRRLTIWSMASTSPSRSSEMRSESSSVIPPPLPRLAAPRWRA